MEEQNTITVQVEDVMNLAEDSLAKHNIVEGKILNNTLIIMYVKVGKLMKNINLNS